MKRIEFFDGGMGTMLQARGLKAGELPEALNLTDPELIYSVHKAYADAGADYITTNTFGANSLKFDNVEEIVKSAVSLAKRTGKKAALDIGPLGRLLKPMGELDFEDAYRLFSEIVTAGRDGADVILLETMTDTLEMKAAVLAAKENSGLPVFVSMMFDDSRRLLTGADILSAVTMLEGLGADAIGINCGLGPEQMYPIAAELRKATRLPMLVNPNAGLPEAVNGKTVFNIEPDEFASWMKKIAALGVSYLGGCCGTTPEHIGKLVENCSDIPSRMPDIPRRTLVSSYSKTVEIGDEPVIIGERINPTGKKLMKAALRENDINYILKEGLAQKDKGAHILDVNVGLPEIDEPVMMKKAVFSLQSVLDLPLQIDTSNPEAMEAALRIYNGKAMINSVNGKKESMEAIFPLAAKYGAVTVCLCLDDEGIPATAEGRIRIAKNIIRTAEDYGIDKSELVFDALAMTVSTGALNAVETLKAVRLLTEELGVKTVLGVSNVSFGLPKREAVNTSFFTLAMENGLSAGIINPLSEPMMNAYYAFRALNGMDENCADYISNVSEQPKAAAASVTDLKTAIVKGMTKEAAECAKLMSESTAGLEIISNYIVPALDEVGERFENKTLFLPQLLMSADSAKAAFEAIRERMITAGAEREKSGKVVLATVHGDIHDIGKNIVRVLLENYGFDVIDLGRDVPPEKVLEAVKENDAGLVGLSALMTTTVPAMEETIKLIHRETDAKVIVGGAVMTKKYARMIDADYYGGDAMETVRIAKEYYSC